MGYGMATGEFAFFFLQMLILNLIEERGVRRRRWLEMEVASEGLKRWDKEK